MAPRSPRIIVVGYNAFDVSLPTGPITRPDQKHEVDQIVLGGGGPGANAAIALTRLGAQVRLITPLTGDPPGQLQIRELQEAGVDISLSPRLDGYSTAKAVILVNPDSGERTIFWTRGDLPHLEPASMDPAWLAETDLLYTDGHEPMAFLALARQARSLGIPRVLDAGSVREGTRELVPMCSDVISSETFACQFTPNADPVAALEAIAEQGPGQVAMTRGAGGILALTERGPVAIAAFAVPVVDTTGAGDVFHAGFAFARARGMSFLSCLDFGNATAGLKCGHWGGRKGAPDQQSVLELLQRGERKPLDPALAGLPVFP